MLAAGGLFACFWRLTTPAWGVDEVIYRDAGAQYVDGVFTLNRGHPWLTKEILGVSQELLGATKLGVRLPMALCAFATGLVLFALGRRLAGPLAGLAAAGAWWLLPQSPGINVARLDRYGNLEPPMFLFLALALYAAWRWGERGTWPWALGAAVASGLAVSSKFPAVLVLPAVGVVVLWVPKPWTRRAGQAAAMVAVAAVAFAVPYLPDGLHGLAAVREGFLDQTKHASEGHLQIVAGTTYAFPPWWSHVWWQTQYLRPLGMVVVWALTLVGMLGRARADVRLAGFLGAAIVPGAVVLAVSSLKLPHYHLVLAPSQALAVGVGVAVLAAAARPLALAGALALGLLALGQLATVATIEPDGYAAAAEVVPEGADVLVFGYTQPARDELPGRAVVDAVPVAPPDAIVVDPVIADRFTSSPLVGYVERVRGDYEHRRVDRLDVYTRR